MNNSIANLKDDEIRELYDSIKQSSVRESMVSELQKGACKYSFHNTFFTLITPNDLFELYEFIQEKINKIHENQKCNRKLRIVK